MAKTTEQLVVEITAQLAKARKDVTAFEKQLNAIDADKHVAKITAEVANRRDIDKFIDSLDALSDESKTVTLALEAASAERQLNDMRLLMRELASQGIDIPVELAAGAATVEGDLRRIEETIQRINAKPIQPGGGRARGGFDQVINGADQANVAVSNMVGNAAQDLAQLGGITGSAGQAVGQLADNFVDSAIQARKAGQGYGAIIGNFAKAALPIAAIAAGISAFTGAQERASQRTEESTKTLEDFSKAMRTAGTDTIGLAAALRENEAGLRNFDASMSQLGGFGTTLNDFGKSVPLLGSLFQDTSVDIVDALDAAGLSIYQFVKGFSGTEAERQQFLQDLEDFRDAGLITDKQYKGLTQRTKENSTAVDDARQSQKLWNVDQREANDLLQEYLKQQDPFQRFHREWKTLFDDLADGTVDTKASATAINFLAEQLGIDPGDVIPMAMEELDRAEQENIKTTEEWAEAQRKAKQEADDFTVTLTEAAAALADMATPFSRMSRREDALQAAFDLGDAGLNALQTTSDVHEAIQDLWDFLDESGLHIRGNVNDALDNWIKGGGDLNTAPLLGKIETLRTTVQAKISDAFITGGEPAARAMALNLIAQITDSLHGRLTAEQVAQLTGLDQFEVLIKIAVDQESLMTARGLLEVLTGVGGATPFTAAVALALEAGTITEQGAQQLVADALGEHGVPVPTELLPADKTAAKADADRWARDPANAVAMRSMLGTPFNLTKAYNDTKQLMANLPALQWKTALTIPGAGDILGMFAADAGTPSMPRPGGIVAERRPEIINGRYLVTEPSWVPPGTRVTSGSRTARILRTRGVQGLRRYDSGGMVGGPSTVNINFNGVGAIGNRYDLMRTVKRANIDRLRIQGNRP